jgi:hypothetical protein
MSDDQNASNDQKSVDVAVGSSVIDLWARDNDNDNGDVPTSGFWQSSDIWIRNQPDGGVTHQDPIAGQPNYVYLRVRNRGSAPSSGSDSAKVYWHEPSLGIKCGDWAEIGSQPIASIPAQTGETLLVFPWNPIRSGHTCLHGEIISTDDPIANPCDVPWDNNLNQRNVNIIAPATGLDQGLDAQAAGEITFSVTNVKAAAKPVDLMVDVSGVPDSNAVRLDLGSVLGFRWATAGAAGSGIDWTGGTVVTITASSTGTITGIPMLAGETQTVTLRVDAPSASTAQVTVYEAIDSGMGVSLVDAVIGGNTYIFGSETNVTYLPIILKQ